MSFAPPFQSTLPIREETVTRAEGDKPMTNFNPLFPYGKRRRWPCGACCTTANFNPLFPYGKRQAGEAQWRELLVISIHSSHTGRDVRRSADQQRIVISIHSSHTGRDVRHPLPLSLFISIHSSHTGRDLGVQVVGGLGTDFNPLFPYGKRPCRDGLLVGRSNFNPLFPYGKRQKVPILIAQ